MTQVTVITPAHNAGPFIERAVTSVLGQTFTDFEYLVVVDGGTDDTASRCQALALSDPRMKVVELATNQGAAHARNVGIARASGRLVTFLDADDFWRDDFLELMLRALASQPETCAGVFCRVRMVDRSMQPVLARLPGSGRYELLRFLEQVSPHVCGSTLLLRLDRVRAAGGLGPSWVGHDTELLLELLARPGAFLYALPLRLVTYVRRPTSLTSGPIHRRLASFDYRLTRFLPLLPPADRATAAYGYLKRAAFLGATAWAAAWARQLLANAWRDCRVNLRKPRRLIGTAVIATGSRQWVGAILVKVMRFARRRDLNLLLPTAARERTFEMQRFSPDGRPSHNPYTFLASQALTRAGWTTVECGSPAVWHLHWLHLYLFSRDPSTRLYRIAWFRTAKFMARLAWRKLRGRKTVWTVHNLGNHERRHARFDRFATGLAVRLVDDLVVHTDAAKVALHVAFPVTRGKRVHCIPHPTYAGFYPDEIGRDAARRSLDLPANARVIVSLGLIRGYKGHRELILAFKQVPDPAARLIIAGRAHGEPSLLQDLYDLAAPDARIRIIPQFIPDASVQFYLRAADVAAFAYRDILTSGGIPLVQAFGLPCLAPDFAPLRDQLRQWPACFYDPASPESLVEALRSVMARVDARCGRTNQAQITWDEAATRLAEVYEAPAATLVRAAPA